MNLARWPIPAILALGRQGWKGGCEVNASLVNNEPASYIVKPWKERDAREGGGRRRGEEERDRRRGEERNEEIWRMDGGKEEGNKG